jgi:catechol O-methyltransferase
MASSWRKIPFLRWSFWRLVFGVRHLTTQWQVGDGREARLAEYVLARARHRDAADVIRVIDEFGYNQSILINVGDEKGRILDAAMAKGRPARVLELGTYCGYSALRMAVAAPSAQIVSIEFNAANAEIARRILDHAGVGTRVTIVVGTLGDGGKTFARCEPRMALAPAQSIWCSSTTPRKPTCPTCGASSNRIGCDRAPWSWPTTSSSPALPSIGPT